MRKLLILSTTLLLSSCGLYQWWGSKGADHHSREIASLSVQQLIAEDERELNSELDSKLTSLHIYYMLGQKNLALFDEQMETSDIEKIYESAPYLKLLAIRTQVEEIEDEIEEAFSRLKSSKSKTNNLKEMLIYSRVLWFSSHSVAAHTSMENIRYRLGTKDHKSIAKMKPLTLEEIDKELETLTRIPEYQVYEKNIEHLAHMLKVKISTEGKRFYPSETKSGNINGNEFPPKVWSLTFDDGPNNSTTLDILKSLQDKKLKATFFQLTLMAQAHPDSARQIRDAGMEIASHSYSHKQLTKVGGTVLEHEITEAIADLKKIHGTEIRFFRLPYGAGLNSSIIRQKIAANGAIHVFWNIDTLDWMPQPSKKIITRATTLMKKTKHDAGILLFHDIHARTAVASASIMDYLNEDGRRVCTLGEIVDQMNEGVETVCPKQ